MFPPVVAVIQAEVRVPVPVGEVEEDMQDWGMQVVSNIKGLCSSSNHCNNRSIQAEAVEEGRKIMDRVRLPIITGLLLTDFGLCVCVYVCYCLLGGDDMIIPCCGKLPVG